MKKILKVLALFGVCFSLSSCDSLFPIINPPVNSSSQQENTSSSQEENTSSKDSVNNDVNGSQATIMNRVYELAENIDKTPSLNGLSTSNKTIKKNAKMDVINPENNEYYQNHLSLGGTVSDYFELNSYADSYVNMIKYTKNSVLNEVECLNTWVKAYTSPGTIIKYRINYDQEIDQASFEEYSYVSDINSVSYRSVISTYDAEGNIVINGTYYSYIESDVQLQIIKVSYVENNYFDISIIGELNEYSNRAAFLIHSDLTEESPVVTSNRVWYNDNYDSYNFSILKQVYQPANENDPGIGYSTSYIVNEMIEGHPYNETMIDGNWQDSFSNHQDSLLIVNSNNEHVLTASRSQQYYFIEFDPYQLNGIKSLDLEESTYTMTFGNEVEVLLDSNYIGSKNNTLTYEDYSGMFDLRRQVRNCPTLHLMVMKENNTSKTFEEIVNDIMDKYGLSFKDESVKAKLDRLDHIEENIAQYNFVGVSAGDCVYPTDIYSMVYHRIGDRKTKQDLFDMAEDTSGVYNGEQIKEENILGVNEYSLEGNVSYDRNEKLIDLNETILSLTDDENLTKGNEYTLVVSLTDGIKKIRIAEEKFVYSGDSEVKLGKYAVPQEIENGNYKVSVYLLDDKGKRISQIYSPILKESIDIIEINESSLVRYVGSDNLTIIVQEHFEVSEEPLSLLNRNILIKGDKISINLVDVNASGEEYEVLASASREYGKLTASLSFENFNEISFDESKTYEIILSIENSSNQKVLEKTYSLDI